MNWQSIDTAPKDGTVFIGLCATDEPVLSVRAYRWIEAGHDNGLYRDAAWLSVCERVYTTGLTHWMPLHVIDSRHAETEKERA